MKTPLCALGEKYGVDKCPAIYHSYTPSYHNILGPYRSDIHNVLEIGIGTYAVMQGIVGPSYCPGASLRMWRDYFTGAEIYGCDIDPTVLITDERINTIHVDQSSPSSLQAMIYQIQQKKGVTEFDLIIDDGSHIVEHMTTSFKTLWPNVSQNGFYIIEDIKAADAEYFTNLPKLLGFNDANIVYYHKGLHDWDDFVVYKKI